MIWRAFLSGLKSVGNGDGQSTAVSTGDETCWSRVSRNENNCELRVKIEASLVNGKVLRFNVTSILTDKNWAQVNRLPVVGDEHGIGADIS